ncbi:DevR family CRISPR-associated autoregulator [soil metagenome]
MKKLFSLSICGIATMNLHSLNNEGGEGNHIQTRMVDVVDTEGRLHSVNAVSGDMYKHIFVEHFYNLARNGADLPLSAGAKVMSPNRVNADLNNDNSNFSKAVAAADGDAGVIDAVLNTCALTDVAGTLITKGRSTGRKSVVEFAWVAGVPEKTKTESYFHVKYDVESRGNTKSDDGSNLGQAIFHRPTNSGQYAVVLNIEAYRVGFNDIKQSYAIEGEARAKRYRALLQAVMQTFIEPNGAMRNTQNPHLTDFRGVVTTSTSSVPAPTVSPLNDEFVDQVTRIVKSLNTLAGDSLQVEEFGSLAAFTEIMVEKVSNTEPASFGGE